MAGCPGSGFFVANSGFSIDLSAARPLKRPENFVFPAA
jgi:hypothetical protein